jgi:hypothetical protein
MKPVPLRVQLILVAAGYAAVLAIATVMVYARHMQYVNHPEEVVASSGMYAAGDLMLEIFIGCMLLVPTFFLVLVIRNSEALYNRYSLILLGLSLTAPLCLGVFSIPAVSQETVDRGTMLLGEICLDRLFVSPLVVVGLVFSRLLARFDRAKRLTLYALLVEVLTLVFMTALFLFSARAHRG